MPIQRPGERYRYSRFLKKRAKGRRGSVVVLSLTAMVDMFTVLVIFLLQNSDPGALNFVPDNIILPRASEVRDLKPAVVISISREDVRVNSVSVVPTQEVRAQEDWIVPALKENILAQLAELEKKYEERNRGVLKRAVSVPQDVEAGTAGWNKITVQADKEIDILTIKKVLTTLTDAGAREVNFAVTKVAQAGN